MSTAFTLHQLSHLSENDLSQLADLLVACVEAGASVSFMSPLTHERALAYWQSVATDLAAGNRALLLARDASHTVVGTVHLILAQPENQPHRADLVKMLVHPTARRQGVATALMREAENLARACHKTLLVLDTVTGAAGDALYEKVGWQRVGTIPDYALYPDGTPCATTYFYKQLAPAPSKPLAQGMRKSAFLLFVISIWMLWMAAETYIRQNPLSSSSLKARKYTERTQDAACCAIPGAVGLIAAYFLWRRKNNDEP